MRDAHDSAAAPAATSRNVRRGNFMRNSIAVEMKLHQLPEREEAFHGLVDQAALRS
jgi:hypothetical protein